MNRILISLSVVLGIAAVGFLVSSQLFWASLIALSGWALLLITSLRQTVKSESTISELKLQADTIPMALSAGYEQKVAELNAKVLKMEDELVTLSATNAEQAHRLNALQKQELSLIPNDQAVVQFVRNLQSKGRLLDFLMTDIHRLPDAQVGAAARIVHQGLRPLIQDYFQVEALSDSAEGSVIALSGEQSQSHYKILQSEGDSLPEKGRVVHRGWIAKNVKLPKAQHKESAEVLAVLAPVEVDAHI